MAGKNEAKGKASRRVHIANEETSPRSPSRPSSPAPSNLGRHSSQGSPTPTQVSATSQSRSRPNLADNQPTVPTSTSSASPSTSAPHRPNDPYGLLPTAIPQPSGNWNPMIFHQHGNMAAPFMQPMNPFFTTAQAAAPPPPPPPVNPPDELGPPPPPPPPPAIPPVVNPYGVHFQPPVPSTEIGPMIHRYIPRHDPAPVLGYGACYPQPAPGYMGCGTAMPMQPMPVNIAPVTAPMNPIIMQQPIAQPMMLPDQMMPGGVGVGVGVGGGGGGFVLPAPAPHPLPMPGNPMIPGLPTQPPVHVEPAMGVGLTPGETMAQNIRMAQNNKAYEPQDFRPADPDPYRLYWFRELNGHWTTFPRRQIDRLDARWYRTDQGVFYAVRLSD